MYVCMYEYKCMLAYDCMYVYMNICKTLYLYVCMSMYDLNSCFNLVSSRAVILRRVSPNMASAWWQKIDTWTLNVEYTMNNQFPNTYIHTYIHTHLEALCQQIEIVSTLLYIHTYIHTYIQNICFCYSIHTYCYIKPSQPNLLCREPVCLSHERILREVGIFGLLH